jgi:mevalonate pyrophosphate decarboxylase
MENIECYHQTLIDMKKYYRKDVETFVKAIEQNSNHMHLACILATSQATQMEAKLLRMQAEHHEDGRF